MNAMNSAETAKRQAEEAERLRTDTAFASAVTSAHTAARDELTALNARLAEAAILNRDTGEIVGQIVLARARIDAINAITTEIANAIVRGRNQDGPDRA